MKKIQRFLFVLMVWAPVALQAQDGYDSAAYETEDTYSADDGSYDETETTFSDQASYSPVDATSLDRTKEYQKEKLDVHKFDKKEWKKIVGSTDYKEKKEEKLKEEVIEEATAGESSESMELNSPWSGEGLQVIFYILVIGVVLLILWAVLRNISFDVKLKRTVAVEDAVSDFEHIEELDIDAYLRKAREEKNYKLAVRLYYLGLLKRLNATGFILWRKDKTNLDYLNEIFSRDFHYNDIRKLTLAYEEVWYGERNLTDESFQSVTSGFESMFGKINAQPAS